MNCLTFTFPLHRNLTVVHLCRSSIFQSEKWFGRKVWNVCVHMWYTYVFQLHYKLQNIKNIQTHKKLKYIYQTLIFNMPHDTRTTAFTPQTTRKVFLLIQSHIQINECGGILKNNIFLTEKKYEMWNLSIWYIIICNIINLVIKKINYLFDNSGSCLIFLPYYLKKSPLTIFQRQVSSLMLCTSVNTLVKCNSRFNVYFLKCVVE